MEIAWQIAKQKAAVRGKTEEHPPTKQTKGAAKLTIDFMRRLKPFDFFRSDYGKYKDFTDQGLQVELQSGNVVEKELSFWKN